MTIVNSPSDPAEWHALRLRHVGGSEVAALFGVQQAYQMSHYALWHVKSGILPDPGSSGDEEDEERIEWGVKLEPLIAEAAARRWGWGIRKGGYAIDDTTPGLGASLDFEITSHTESDPGCIGPGVLETKNVDTFIHMKTWSGDEPPPHILLQLQHQLAASGYAWGAIAALVGGNRLRVWKYKMRPRMIDAIRERVAAFWRSIADMQIPLTDGSDSTADALRQLYTTWTDQERIIESSDLAAECLGWMTDGEARRDADKREKAHKAFIIAAAEGHKRLLVPSPEDGCSYRVGIAENHRLSIKQVELT